MIAPLRNIPERDLRFLAMLLVTGCLIALVLVEGLRLQAPGGAAWRALDLPALQRRIDSGELRNREALWYHQATEQETKAGAAQAPP